jgi:serine/threonine protein kinase/tetratricopeptide (TPR) repeat protein
MSEGPDKTVELGRQETPLPPGRAVAHYRILDVLGRGGMGIVYRAEDLKLKRTVALKFLPPELTGDPEAKERFIREAQAASALDHTNICTVFEIGETEAGAMFIAMAYYQGSTLRERLRQGSLSVREAADVALQVARGLSKAHERGIIHRDIKPENIITSDDGVAKILDFGLAKLAGQANLTKTGVTAGTVNYMSPEQARGGDVDHRTDIWSLGVVLYESLAGRRPFASDSSQAVIYSILHEEPPSLSTLRPGLPKPLVAVVRKATTKDPAGRYQSAADLAADLEAVLHTLAGRAEPGPLGRPTSRLGSRRSLVWGVLALAVLGVVLVISLRQRSPAVGDPGRKSLAVLPFRDLSDRKDGEYFSDGVTDQVTSQLSRLADLRVISGASAMRYRNSPKNLKAIAGELGVVCIVEGSVRRAGGRVKIAAQLVDARSGRPIWSETYDRDLAEIFAIQTDIAGRIASSLGVAASAEEGTRSPKRPTADLEAYDYYLRGMDYYDRRRKQDNEQAIALFNKAVERDPGFARAYAALGVAYAQQHYYEPGAGNALPTSIAMSQKALTLDPTLPEAHRALGNAYFFKGWATRAIDCYYQAIKQDPNYAAAMANLGVALFNVGQLDEGLKWQRRAVSLEPTSIAQYAFVGDTYLDLADDEEAERWYAKALELQPELMRARGGLAQLRLFQDRRDDALKEVERMLASAPEDPLSAWYVGFVHLVRGEYKDAEPFLEKVANTGGLAIVYQRTGRKEEAREELEYAIDAQQGLLREGYELYGVPYTLAQLCAVWGNKDAAYEWLERAVKGGFPKYRFCRIDPAMASLRGEERFEQLMKKVQDNVQRMRRAAEASPPPRRGP